MPLRQIHRDSRHPFEWVMILFLFNYSIFQAVFDLFPGAIDTYVSGGWKYAWGLLLCVGAGMTMVGILLRRDSTGLTLERVGLVLTAGCCLAYAYALASLGVTTAWLVMSFFVSFALACWMRSRKIRRDMKSVAEGKFRFVQIEVPAIGDTRDRSEGGGSIP